MRSFLLGQSPTIAVYGSRRLCARLLYTSRSSRVAVEVHWLRLGVCAGLNELAAARRLFFTGGGGALAAVAGGGGARRESA